MYKILTKNNIVQMKRTFRYINRLISSKSNSLSLSGVYPPIITPFNEHEEIAFDKLKYNLQKWKSNPLRGVFYLRSYLLGNCMCYYLNFLAFRKYNHFTSFFLFLFLKKSFSNILMKSVFLFLPFFFKIHIMFINNVMLYFVFKR